MALSKPMNVASWILRIVVAVILLQSLFFKFTGAPAAVQIFSTVDEAVGEMTGLRGLMEPAGRIGTGVAELVAAILLLIPVTVTFGAVIAVLIVAGAIYFHLFSDLGIAVVVDGQSDGGFLFILALVVLVASLATLIIKWRGSC